MKLTPFQQYELIGLLDIRLETIIDDPESADSGIDTPEDERFETEDNLNALKAKFEAGEGEFTPLEKKWIIDECEARISVFEANGGMEGHAKTMAYSRSLQTLIDKLS